MKKIEARARALSNPKFFSIFTASLGMLEFAEPNVEPIYLKPDAADELLGHSLRQALSKSRIVSLEEFNEIFDSGIVQKRAKESDVWSMKTYGFKTKRALYHNMHCCTVRISEGQIEISPTDRNSFDGIRGTANGMQDRIYVPVSASDAELGSALREGFNRCTSSYSG